MTTQKNKDRTILLLLLAATLVFRLWTVMMIHTGVDERDYWYSAKSISQGYEYPYVNHRTIRWGVIGPVALAQSLFGVHPNAYYVLPIINALAQTALLYLLGLRLFNRRVGALAALCLILFPYQIRAASQVRPEIFSITYILAMVFFFSRYLAAVERKESLKYLALSAAMLFASYETKITNLFFMPGMFALIFLYKRETRFRDGLLFGGIPLAGFVVETVLYGIFAGYRFGQLEIIMSKHVTGMETLSSFAEVFNRYRSPWLQAYWQIPFALFAVLAVYTVARNRKRELVLLIAPAVSFFLFITFTVSSIEPIKMAEPFINRYFSAVLPAVFLVISFYADRLSRRLRIPAPSCRSFARLTAAGTLAFMVLFSLPFLPAKAREYVRCPLSGDHPFRENARYRAFINDAWKKGFAIVGWREDSGYNACATASWYYLDGDKYVDNAAPRPERITVDLGGVPVEAYSLAGRMPSTTFVNAIRDPFRVREIPLDAIRNIEAERFPE